jgi:hypothetical protein
MSSNSNFSIENFNIARFAAQIESNMQAANTEYTRLMPLTDADRTWNLHVYDFRAMVNGVAICAPETTLQPGDPRSTSGPAPRPPLDHTLLQDCPDPGVGDTRRLTGDGSLNLGEDSSLNCGVLQNYIWNEPREGKTAVLRIIFSKELRVGVNVFLSNSSGTAQYVRCRDYLCAAIQSSCRVGEEGDADRSKPRRERSLSPFSNVQPPEIFPVTCPTAHVFQIICTGRQILSTASLDGYEEA